MSKVPVQKTVVRDGKVHTQTYWEGTDASRAPAAALASSRPTLAPQQQIEHDPVADAWSLVEEQPWTEACIAAGILPEAAKEMVLTYRGEDLAEFIYANGLDLMPRPQRGWGVTMHQDDRRGWEIAINDSDGSITWEDAVAWSDAGFRYPWSGIQSVVRSGVAPERAAEWNRTFEARYEDAIARFLPEMLTPDLTAEEAVAWRDGVHGDRNRALDDRDLQFRKLGFTPKAAKGWRGVLMGETSLLDAKALKDLKWSPTTIRKFLKAAASSGTEYHYLPQSLASDLRRATEALGDVKAVLAWAPVVYRQHHHGYSEPEAIRSVQQAEAWLKRLRDEAGVELSEDDYPTVARMFPLPRETFIELAKEMGLAEHRQGRTHSAYLNLAHNIGSPQNLQLLRDHGFHFPADVPDRTNMERVRFDAATAAPAERDKWMRRMAVDMYWRKGTEGTSMRFILDSERNAVVNDETIDPVMLKDTLLSADGDINPLRLEAIVKSGVPSAVSDGFL